MSGRTLAGRAGSGVDLAECVSVAGLFLRPQGPSPRLLPHSNKGNADGAVGIFGKCRARVGYGPAPGPTKKGLVQHFHVRRGMEQIPQLLIGIVPERWRLEIALDHLTCNRNNGSNTIVGLYLYSIFTNPMFLSTNSLSIAYTFS